MVNNGRKIISGTAMIKAKCFIHLTAATAVVPCEHIKALIIKCFCHALHVSAMRIPLKAMRNDNYFLDASPEPIQIEEIAIRQSNSFSLVLQVHFPEK